jgi:Transglutaminase-like superfamily
MLGINRLYQGLHQKIQGWHQLSKLERYLFIQAIVLFPCLYMALRLWGLQRVQRILAARTQSFIQAAKADADRAQLGQSPSDLRLVQSIDIVDRAGWYLPKLANCLRRSLTLWYLLRCQGIESDLRIGVRRSDAGEFQAHAWVEHNGAVLNDRQDIHTLYAAFEGGVNNYAAQWPD